MQEWSGGRRACAAGPASHENLKNLLYNRAGQQPFEGGCTGFKNPGSE